MRYFYLNRENHSTFRFAWSTVTFKLAYDVEIALAPPYLLAATARCVPIHAFSFQRRSTSGHLRCTTRELDAWVGSGVRFSPSSNSTHRLHFLERFATTMAQCPLQKWCVTFRFARPFYARSLSCSGNGSILYHGCADHEIPVSLDWLAFDFDHAYFVCISI